MTPPVAMTIAGSDSGGGAGLQADLKAFAALGVFGTSAVTAITAQNTAEVRDVQPIPAAMVRRQVEAVLDDLPVAAVKTGMLANLEIVSTVAALAADGRLPNLVADPVMVASSGARLLSVDAEATYRRLLLPRALVVTPNRLEAEVLLGAEIVTLDHQRAAARRLAALGPAWVVVTGGHPAADHAQDAIDVVAERDSGDVHELRSPRISSDNTHGSGCTFAAAIAAHLARGHPPVDAIAAANTYVHDAIRGAACWRLGSGHGPLDHLRWDIA